MSASLDNNSILLVLFSIELNLIDKYKQTMHETQLTMWCYVQIMDIESTLIIDQFEILVNSIFKKKNHWWSLI